VTFSTRARASALTLLAALTLAGCGPEADPGSAAGPSATASAPSSQGTPSGPPSSPQTSAPAPPSPADPSTSAGADPEPEHANPVVRRIPDGQWAEIVATGSWRPGCPVGRAGLRRVEVNHHTFAGGVRRGVLVVNKDVAPSIARIFTHLYDQGFPIRRMRPVEAYDGDSNASLRADNTAAFNCRRPDQINAPVLKSPHANGRAIDINPRENPWKDLRCDCWSPGPRHKARRPGPGMILDGGLVFRTFRAEGWIWQNIDVPDYMHFDTGYPSRPFRGPKG
jgi:hypothetical protein